MNPASGHWDRVFREVLRLSEEEKVKIAELLKQQVEQAKKHPKYFSAQVYAILQFIDGYREIMPKEILEVTNQIYNMISEG
ncbi:MAG: hypothetical protein ACE5OW_04665 [Candidatus Bathyarchaeia archaeon]